MARPSSFRLAGAVSGATSTPSQSPACGARDCGPCACTGPSCASSWLLVSTTEDPVCRPLRTLMPAPWPNLTTTPSAMVNCAVSAAMAVVMPNAMARAAMERRRSTDSGLRHAAVDSVKPAHWKNGERCMLISFLWVHRDRAAGRRREAGGAGRDLGGSGGNRSEGGVARVARVGIPGDAVGDRAYGGDGAGEGDGQGSSRVLAC
uniref:Predicted protein n=1 Tax=Physcomitrium patens TaxID=3218 RepID=A9U817_PHYPA